MRNRKQKVLVKNKTGKQRYFPSDEVTAHVLEEEFHLVRTHLEGSDHSAHFPNKTTGIYDKLKPSVIYIVYGHPYNKWAVWSPQAKTPDSRRISSQSLVESSKESLLLPNEVPVDNVSNLKELVLNISGEWSTNKWVA